MRINKINANFRGIVEEKKAINLLRELININSVNPLEDISVYGEKELASFVNRYLKKIGIKTIFYPISNERSNVIGVLEGKSGGKNLVLEAHMDTVTAENMKIEPFLAKVEEGRIYGRGACDDKGSLASMILAMKVLKEERVPLRGDLYLAAVIDEEHKQRGISHLLNQGFNFDAGIVGEPTNLDIIIAHQGCLRWRIITKGVSAHSSEPEKGENAIYYMSKVIDAIQRDLIPNLKEKYHPLVGSPALSVNIIQGGTQVNIIPDRCSITIDRRMIPGENNQDILQEVDKFLYKLKQENPLLKIEREEPFVTSPPMQIKKSEKIVKALSKCIRDNNAVEPKIKGAKFGMDASIFVNRGIPSVVFGAGNVAQAHSEDEWIEIKQVIQAAEIIAQTGVVFQNEEF